MSQPVRQSVELGLMIDRDAQVPVYVQIAQGIRSAIERGACKPGDLLPSEPELATRLGVSKMTVRQALSELALEGLLERHQGRGTFISPPRVEIQLPFFTSYTLDMLRRGFTPQTSTLSVEEHTASGRQAESFGIAPGSPLFRLIRLRFADERPMLLETTWLRAELLPGFLHHYRGTSSLYELLEKEYGIQPARAEQSLEAVSATPEEARRLGVASGAPLLLVKSLMFDQQQRPIELTKGAYRGDRYKLYFERVRRVHS